MYIFSKIALSFCASPVSKSHQCGSSKTTTYLLSRPSKKAIFSGLGTLPCPSESMLLLQLRDEIILTFVAVFFKKEDGKTEEPDILRVGDCQGLTIIYCWGAQGLKQLIAGALGA